MRYNYSEFSKIKNNKIHPSAVHYTTISKKNIKSSHSNCLRMTSLTKTAFFFKVTKIIQKYIDIQQSNTITKKNCKQKCIYDIKMP